MKTIRNIILAVALCTSTAIANDNHSQIAGPKGGRILDKTTPHAEFVVGKDRSVTINFYDKALKAVAVESQSVTVIANAKSGKATIEFEKSGNSLVSKAKLPDGENYNLVVQFRQTAEAKPQNFRFKLDLSFCSGCKLLEYACTCDH